MKEQTQFWIPDDPYLTDETLVALSIPGPAPSNRAEHRERLKDLLVQLIKDLGVVEAVDLLRGLVADRTLLMLDEPVTPEDLAAALLAADELVSIPEPREHPDQSEYQMEALELTFEERIGRLLR